MLYNPNIRKQKKGIIAFWKHIQVLHLVLLYQRERMLLLSFPVGGYKRFCDLWKNKNESNEWNGFLQVTCLGLCWSDQNNDLLKTHNTGKVFTLGSDSSSVNLMKDVYLLTRIRIININPKTFIDYKQNN